MLLLTLRGTPTMYYGEEIGMLDVPIPPDKVQDPYEKNVPGLGLGRDPARTPMQWDTTYNAGFCNGGSWLPLSDYYQLLNVEMQRDNPHSMLSLHRRLIDLRRREPAFCIGEFTGLEAEGDIFPYVRRHGSRRFLVVLNLGHDPQVYQSSALVGELALSTLPGRQGESVSGAVALRPNEGVIVRLV